MNSKILFVLLALGFCSLAHANGDSCQVDQDGSIEPFYCSQQGTSNSVRCYADVTREDGTKFRVWGNSCYATFSDCWWSGSGRVDVDCP